MQNICCLPCHSCSSADVSVYSFVVSSFHLGKAPIEAVALYDWNAEDDDELTFKEGQIIEEVTVIDYRWSEGRLVHNGQYGMFPTNYVAMRRAAPIEHLPPPVGEFSMLSTRHHVLVEVHHTVFNYIQWKCTSQCSTVYIALLGCFEEVCRKTLSMSELENPQCSDV